MSAWREHALCREVVGVEWFPLGDQRTPAAKANTRRAKAVCSACPVQPQCLAEVLADDYSQHGIRGGYTAAERERMPRPNVPRPINHGTPGGYRMHRYRGEEACDACLRANAEYHATRRAGATA